MTMATQDDLRYNAYRLGRQDARQGRVFRHSADPGSWVRNWLKDYDAGWEKGREINLDSQRAIRIRGSGPFEDDEYAD